jgi:hypothetical protein
MARRCRTHELDEGSDQLADRATLGIRIGSCWTWEPQPLGDHCSITRVFRFRPEGTTDGIPVAHNTSSILRSEGAGNRSRRRPPTGLARPLQDPPWLPSQPKVAGFVARAIVVTNDVRAWLMSAPSR